MTIGIAAYGPRAGLAILRALAAVETIGRGSIGGFVSVVALSPTGAIIRAEAQQGGSRGMFPAGIDSAPSELLTAPVAGLISSGPNRPEPLAQFTPALAGVGLVTGHRMPNTVGVSGRQINDEVVDLMREGIGAEMAVRRVLAANPMADAGIIALSCDGDLFAADSDYVTRRGDSGQAIAGSREGGAVVGVLHNSIHPSRPIATLAAEVALDVMQPMDRIDGWIILRADTPLRAGSANAVEITGTGGVDMIVVEDHRFLSGCWSVGLGYETPIMQGGDYVGIMLHEPYMVVRDACVVTIDGERELRIPIRTVGRTATIS
ncbi:hypothetical protein AncyloWKF20_04055 [Ancylobacter sp. WKF20]|uniref:DUF6963 family protein n=1 Tax=Ancylobacter sp. WKF20 TaxID=3039801 RepID=UPI002434406A|nr:hypothetical protein [Ancylobacter sp. WKF20]WGD31014.1 hypothetical protein AncyloWKF20_04055 [Ancylobacter sp. WKF20]